MRLVYSTEEKRSHPFTLQSMNPDTLSEDVVRVPKWALAFVLPALAFLAVGARTEYRTDLNEAAIRQLESRHERHVEEERSLNLLLRQQVQWLCVQRSRDDREAGRGSAQSAPC